MRTYYFNFEDDSYTLPSGLMDFEMRDIIYIPPDPPDPLPIYHSFTFRESGYAPSSPYIFEFTLGTSGTCEDEWIEYEKDHWPEDSDREWGQCGDPFIYLKQIWTDDNYVYAATTDGLNIIDLLSEQPYAHVTYRDGFNSVWADSNNVYLATPASGVKYITKTCISGSVDVPYELATCLIDYVNAPVILSDQVRYIHGNGEHMVFCTASGINYRGADLSYQKSQGITEIARKVFITPIGKIYYTTWDGIDWKVNIKYADGRDWVSPNKIITTPGVDIIDIYVSENSTGNTIFIATTSGVQVVDETTEVTDTYYTSTSGLAGTSDIFTAIWADSTASRSTGRMYALSWGPGTALSVLNLDDKELYDYYTQNYGGRAEETLTNIDTRDLNVDSP